MLEQPSNLLAGQPRDVAARASLLHRHELDVGTAAPIAAGVALRLGERPQASQHALIVRGLPDNALTGAQYRSAPAAAQTKGVRGPGGTRPGRERAPMAATRNVGGDWTPEHVVPAAIAACTSRTSATARTGTS